MRRYIQLYDSSKLSIYLCVVMYFDVNPYSWTMYQPLPYADFCWVSRQFCWRRKQFWRYDHRDRFTDGLRSRDEFGITATSPWCAFRSTVFSTREKRARNYLASERRSSSCYCIIKSITSYIIAICSNVLITSSLQKSILQFAQSPWLRESHPNSNFRILAKNEFEKNIFKLMNEIFGKIMENMRNHVDVRLVTRWDGRYDVEAMIAKPNFHLEAFFLRTWLR